MALKNSKTPKTIYWTLTMNVFKMPAQTAPPLGCYEWLTPIVSNICTKTGRKCSTCLILYLELSFTPYYPRLGAKLQLNQRVNYIIRLSDFHNSGFDQARLILAHFYVTAFHPFLPQTPTHLRAELQLSWHCECQN